ncbi:hypothetical protein PC9H_001976 [Pleurotus ostreatus]|uniref:Secreted protein n=1 Tax=Pleurotus ostreatus TaxID=5322 RepID=A0A8H6ZKR5_PLEOS|nr:uncharacterized protein PC9H_001976 [Pleurotus ostreatus]KAF7419387.1 hypothetical protein PC9H_001976 [Pleurotus ostreatus]
MSSWLTRTSLILSTIYFLHSTESDTHPRDKPPNHHYEVLYLSRRHCSVICLSVGFESVASREPAGETSTGRRPLLARLRQRRQ